MNHTINHDVESSVRFRPSPPFDKQRGYANQCNGIVKIPLTRGLIATIDAADFGRVSGYRWNVLRRGRVTYAQAAHGVLMHRLILGLEPGSGQRVDHIDHDGLNNRRENLRLVTQAQNCANQRPRIGTKGGFKGVARVGNNWRAEVRRRVNGKMERHYLGTFPSPALAALAYDAKAVELFGEFACLNFPKPPSLFLPPSMGSIATVEVGNDRRAA
jgi:hypothetical protein